MEPEGQRQLAGLEDGPGDDRGLPAAAALAQLLTAPVVAAVRAHESASWHLSSSPVETEAFLEL